MDINKSFIRSIERNLYVLHFYIIISQVKLYMCSYQYYIKMGINKAPRLTGLYLLVLYLVV